jgi:hypothetical protein
MQTESGMTGQRTITDQQKHGDMTITTWSDGRKTARVESSKVEVFKSVLENQEQGLQGR